MLKNGPHLVTCHNKEWKFPSKSFSCHSTQVKAVVNVKHRSGIRTGNENKGPAQWVSMIYFMSLNKHWSDT